MSGDDYRRDYGAAGCADGCAKTMSGASLLIALLVLAVRKGRKR
jgi:hypothetical protein